MKKYILIIILFLILPLNTYAKRGCCSWHGGVSHCAENGRYVCNDGTYSPSCTCQPTINYIYGCTNPNSINYNSNANKDDGSCIAKVYGCTNKDAINYNKEANTSNGSCQFESEEKEEETIPYETKTIYGNDNSIKQEGKDGKKETIYKLIKDETGNIISREKKEENVIDEPIEEIIVKEDKTKNNNNIFPIGLLISFAVIILYKANK